MNRTAYMRSFTPSPPTLPIVRITGPAVDSTYTADWLVTAPAGRPSAIDQDVPVVVASRRVLFHSDIAYWLTR
jgi:hypothetical protein